MEDIVKKFEAIKKNFLTVEDIAVLMDCGKKKASDFRKHFIVKTNQTSDYFPNIIRTSEFLDFYRIDTNLIRDNYVVLHQNGVIS